ncbi:MAG: SPOR domain-containing protein [Pseudomonadota bacterium]
MNQSTRQRVAGSIVLLLAAIVVLPAVLDGDGIPSRDIADRIPERAADPEPPSINPQRPVITADTDELRLPDDSPALSRTASPDDSAEEQSGEPDSRPSPALDQSTGLPEAWSVRLGAFSSEANARRLRDRLQAAGHPAYTGPVDTASGALVGVFVGPLADRGVAEEMKTTLQESFNESGMVVRYRIDE